jgi:hypothetical protein
LIAKSQKFLKNFGLFLDKHNITYKNAKKEDISKNQESIIENSSQNQYSIQGKEIIKNMLSGFRLSVSQIIAYRKCPRCFFFNNILKVPDLKNKSVSMGSAVHTTIYNFAEKKKAGYIMDQEEFVNLFIDRIKKERLSPEDLLETIQKGEQLLRGYYANKINDISVKSINEANFKNLEIQIAGIPITGKIDRIDFLTENQMEIKVLDYKTGNPDNSGSRISIKNLGDYLLQLYFYKLLIENSGIYKGKVTQGQIEFIEPSKSSGLYESKLITFEDSEVSRVVDLIKDTYEKIMALDFSEYNKDGYNKCDHEEYHFIDYQF